MKPLPGGAIVHWKHGNPRANLRSGQGAAAASRAGCKPPAFFILKLVPSNAEKVERLTGMTISELKASGVRLRVNRRRYYLLASDFIEWANSRPSI